MARSIDSAEPRVVPQPMAIPFKWAAQNFFTLNMPANARPIQVSQVIVQNGSHAGDGITAGAVQVKRNGTQVSTNISFTSASAAKKVVRFAPSALYQATDGSPVFYSGGQSRPQGGVTSGDSFALDVSTALGAGVDGIAYVYYTESGAVGPKLIQLPSIPFSWSATTPIAIPLPSGGHAYAIASMAVQNGSTAGTNGGTAGVTITTPTGNVYTANLSTNAPAYSVAYVNALGPDFDGWYPPASRSAFTGTVSSSTMTFTNTTAATAVDGYLTLQLWEN